ncbi:BZ3500_MvSof-1268-A1-R1_Chr10-2g02807 [Microbotryum saponariae]|uniref:BZ3500_MvSof-1268-A1-R1_Chr10-2g02807 protein n=1 Tax=Microbotryum saponariae TaxID=289078 RepID=A0A2X0N9I2_9BASI|nr:BZ3501_MvSof-1269-A2-R1_C27g00009 [Microbotryum saponariae]SDA01577.1 BZ3500_MvSof-1268-A1-R1_Chr10-2g02807 [Microbotryum saponariae]
MIHRPFRTSPIHDAHRLQPGTFSLALALSCAFLPLLYRFPTLARQLIFGREQSVQPCHPTNNIHRLATSRPGSTLLRRPASQPPETIRSVPPHDSPATPRSQLNTFLVRWVGRNNTDDTWMSKQSLRLDHPSVLDAYFAHLDCSNRRLAAR